MLCIGPLHDAVVENPLSVTTVHAIATRISSLLQHRSRCDAIKNALVQLRDVLHTTTGQGLNAIWATLNDMREFSDTVNFQTCFSGVTLPKDLESEFPSCINYLTKNI